MDPLIDGSGWLLPGGRLEPMETTEAGLQRELTEELGADVQVDGLLFTYERMRPGLHEIGFIYEVSPHGLPSPADGQEIPGKEGDLLFNFRWFEVEDLPGISLFPKFLTKALRSLPESPLHIVERDS